MTSVLPPLFSWRSLPEASCILMLLSLPLASFSWNQPNPITLGLIQDKLSTSLVLLSIWTCAMTLLLKPEEKLVKFNISILLWSLFMFFSVSSLVTFFILFELSLIPTLCLIMGWGYQPERLEASFYFIFYTITLSIPLLVTMLWLVKTTGDKYFYYSGMEVIFSGTFSLYILVVFMIKLPLFMTHLWLPKAHVEAPVVGSMILAGVLLKTGGYGIVRVCIYMKKTLVNSGFMALGAIGMVYVCLICLSCTDMKQLIAYSSVSHMNFMVIGLMNYSMTSYSGGVVMMISHGLCSSLMFMLADMVYKRTSSRSTLISKGLLMVAPAMSLLWAVTSLLNMGVPPSVGSISELLIISASKMMNLLYSMTFILYLFLSAFYSVYLYMLINHGNSKLSTFSIQNKELLLSSSHLGPLLGLTLVTKFMLI